MKTSEVLINFLKNIPHNCNRVAQWYNPNMEVQINVLRLDGDCEAPGVYSDDKQPYKWYNVRIPKNAKSDPIDNDYNLSYPLDIYVDSIGMTGWDWKNKQSIRFGFDFDNISSHAAGIGITDDQLEHIKVVAHDIPELLILRSTGGSGLHLYLECDPEDLPNTKTHTEHAALALAALNDLSERVGFDFHAHLDVGGGNMWIWARKMTKENQGLTIEKDNIDENGNRVYYTPPPNWKDYIDVATGKRKTPKVGDLSDEDQELLDKQHNTHVKIKLSDEHYRLINDLHTLCPEATTAWVSEKNALQAHTAAIKVVFQTNEYKGIFDTLSKGTDLTKPNCFCYPQEDGSWRVHRFGKGTNETPGWKTSKEGWTSCAFNAPVPLSIAARATGAEDTDGGFVFNSQAEALKAAQALGTLIQIPEELQGRKTKLITRPDGRLMVEIVTINKHDNDLDITGWIKKRGQWTKLFGTGCEQSQAPDVDLDALDEITRSLITPEHDPCGWAIRHTEGYWILTKKDDAKTLVAGSIFAKQQSPAMASALSNSWTVVNLPFQTEYPGGRKWNRDGAQLKMQPANLEDDEVPYHPHWDMILKHCGQDLDAGLVNNKWAQDNNIRTGTDFLMSWIVSVFRHPFEQLPYLFFHGLQCSGKSIFHEALSLLLTKGVIRADNCLTNPQGFNGELAGAIICVVEEKNISTNKDSYARLKDWVTGLNLGIHPKFKQVYSTRNTTHWLHMANEANNCPIFPGDTRVISIYVPPFTNEEIPKTEFLEILTSEAPHFLTSIQRWQSPEVNGRLRLPIISTPSRVVQEEVNRNPLEVYIEDQCFYAPGEYIPMKDFYSKFALILTPAEKSNWQRRNVICEMRQDYPVGNYDKQQVVGNLSYSLPTEDNPTMKFIREGSRLILTEIGE